MKKLTKLTLSTRNKGRNQHSHSGCKERRKLLKNDAIITAKMKNLGTSLKKIALRLGVSYGYAREVWSNHVRRELTRRGTPQTPSTPSTSRFPVNLHGYYWEIELLSDFYDRAPMKVSNNHNRQKVYQHKQFTFVIYPQGCVRIYPSHSASEDTWKKSLLEWLRTWIHTTMAEMITNEIYEVGNHHIAFRAPGVSKGIRLRMRGLGTVTTDGSPFREGTFEYEWDPGIQKTLDGICRILTPVSSRLQKIDDELNHVRSELDILQNCNSILLQRITRLEDLQMMLIAAITGQTEVLKQVFVQLLKLVALSNDRVDSERK